MAHQKIHPRIFLTVLLLSSYLHLHPHHLSFQSVPCGDVVETFISRPRRGEARHLDFETEAMRDI